jgi:hypothetical protein
MFSVQKLPGGQLHGMFELWEPEEGAPGERVHDERGVAQHVINHINTVHRIPDNISFEEAALITNLGCVLYGFETVGG